MAKAFSRTDRVSEQMRRELADLLMFEVKDPRVQMVTLTGVEVTGDMAHAKVFYTAQKKQQGLAGRAGKSRWLFALATGQAHDAAYHAAITLCL